MAERYGKIPPRFTKRWWKYFWHYYKIHTIVVVLAIIFIISGIYGKLTEPEYDITLTYAGFTDYTDKQIQKVQDSFSEICPDVDENGEKLLRFDVFSFLNDDEADPEYNMAIATKFNLVLGEGESYIYIIEKEYLDEYLRNEGNNTSFEDIDSWCTEDITEDRIYKSGDKKVAIKLDGNKMLKRAGVLTDNNYLLLRYKPRENDQAYQNKGYKMATELANKIIKD